MNNLLEKILEENAKHTNSLFFIIQYTIWLYEQRVWEDNNGRELMKWTIREK
jgi:hypothetical protein